MVQIKDLIIKPNKYKLKEKTYYLYLLWIKKDLEP